MFTIGEIIDLAIQIEKNGENFFREARRRMDSPAMQRALSWMADEEACHGQWFANFRQSVADRETNPRLAAVGRQILYDFLGEQTFSLKEADLSSLRTLPDLLRLAQEFERDTVVFYELLGATIDAPEILNQLEQIIAEERRHAKVLGLCCNQGSEEAVLQALLAAERATTAGS